VLCVARVCVVVVSVGNVVLEVEELLDGVVFVIGVLWYVVWCIG